MALKLGQSVFVGLSTLPSLGHLMDGSAIHVSGGELLHLRAFYPSPAGHNTPVTEVAIPEVLLRVSSLGVV